MFCLLFSPTGESDHKEAMLTYRTLVSWLANTDLYVPLFPLNLHLMSFHILS